MTMEIMNEKNIYSISKVSQQNPRVLCISPEALQHIQSSLGAVGVLHASQLTVLGYLHKAGCCRQAKPLPAAKGWEQRQCCPPEPAGGGRHQPCA